MKKYNLRQIFIPALMMMCLSLFPLKAFSEKEINISGKVEFLNPSFFDKYNCVWVKQGLSENSGSVDSVKVASDGTFSIKVKVPSEGFYQLDIVKWQTVTFWADDDINITCRGYDTAKIKVRNSGYININSNSAINNQINFFNYLNNQDQKVLNQLIAESSASLKYRNVDSTWYTYLRENNLYREISQDIDKRTLMAINNTTDASVKLFLINQLDKEKYLDFMIKEVNNIVRKEPDFQDALAYKNILADYYESLSKTKIGNHMPDFEYLTNEGNPMKFSTLKGNYVIIDFWASWCGPCRKSMPKLKNLYQQYNAKGLDILSISIDTDDNAWKKAMEEEAMPWHQMITPDKNKTMSDFRIKGVPTLFLVDKDGVIVEKFTGYNQRLEELLKNYLD